MYHHVRKDIISFEATVTRSRSSLMVTICHDQTLPYGARLVGLLIAIVLLPITVFFGVEYFLYWRVFEQGYAAFVSSAFVNPFSSRGCHLAGSKQDWKHVLVSRRFPWYCAIMHVLLVLGLIGSIAVYALRRTRFFGHQYMDPLMYVLAMMFAFVVAVILSELVAFLCWLTVQVARCCCARGPAPFLPLSSPTAAPPTLSASPAASSPATSSPAAASPEASSPAASSPAASSNLALACSVATACKSPDSAVASQRACAVSAVAAASTSRDAAPVLDDVHASEPLSVCMCVVVSARCVWHRFTRCPPAFLTASQLHVARVRVCLCVLLTAAIAGVGMYQAIGVEPNVLHEELSLARWPAALNGFRIALAADIHAGPATDAEAVRHIVDQLNSMNADMIVLAGDVADGPWASEHERTEPLAALRAPHGVVLVPGNHEYYHDDADTWLNYFRSPPFNFMVLRNELRSMRLEREQPASSAAIDVVAIDDSWHSAQALHSILMRANRSSDRFALVVSHRPATVDQVSAEQLDLQLSGHLHRGHTFPLMLYTWLRYQHVFGHYVINQRTQLFVSGGARFWMPLRLFCPKDVALLTLRQPPA